jgi:hypothetical protein
MPPSKEKACTSSGGVGESSEVTFQLSVRGTHPGAHAPGRVAAGEVVSLRREPENPADRKAMCVDDEFGRRVGRLSWDVAGVLSPMLDGGQLTVSQGVAGRVWFDRYTRVTIAVAFSGPPGIITELEQAFLALTQL